MGALLRVCHSGVVDVLTQASPVSLVPCVLTWHPEMSSQQMIFTTIGAAFGTAKAGIGIAGVGQFK